MATLKEIRINAGMTQPQLAEIIKSNAPAICNYENGVLLPNLEDMVILQKRFGQRLDWQEKYTPKRKHEIIQSLIELYERYPIETVCEFANRLFHREQHADVLIDFYAEASTGYSETPMAPTGVVFRTK